MNVTDRQTDRWLDKWMDNITVLCIASDDKNYNNYVQYLSDLQFCGFMTYHSITLETKLRFYNTCILPIFLYCAETWSVTVILSKKIDALIEALVPQTDSQCPLVRIRHQ